MKSNGLIIKECIHHGEYESREIKVNNLMFPKLFTACPICLDQEEKMVEKIELTEKIKAFGIPDRFMDCSFESYEVSNESKFNFSVVKAYYNKFAKLSKLGTSMTMIGNPGTGKTHLACALALALIKDGKFAKYVISYDMLTSIKSTFDFKSKHNQQHIIECYAEYDLLIIDEVGKQFGTEAEMTLFYKVVNGGYNKMKPIVLISNLNEQGIISYIGESTFDRLKENNGVTLSFNWESHRK
jgi:DNA replication protein DnaC